MHVRQQIRNAITAKIKEIPVLSTSTFESRVYQLSPADLPAALVYTESEVTEPATKQHQSGIQRRAIETVVYLFTRVDELLENSLDDLSEKVENKLFEDQTFGGIAVMTTLDNTQIHVGGDPDAPTGAARMSFITIVVTQQGESGLPIQRTGGIF